MQCAEVSCWVAHFEQQPLARNICLWKGTSKWSSLSLCLLWRCWYMCTRDDSFFNSRNLQHKLIHLIAVKYTHNAKIEGKRKKRGYTKVQLCCLAKLALEESPPKQNMPSHSSLFWPCSKRIHVDWGSTYFVHLFHSVMAGLMGQEIHQYTRYTGSSNGRQYWSIK